ncbi:MAG: hypothetical protein SVR81_10190, partial [Chloroflexota bacterium]|nr:hypothetical protein [Chloroflexota bacterium]
MKRFIGKQTRAHLLPQLFMVIGLLLSACAGGASVSAAESHSTGTSVPTLSETEEDAAFQSAASETPEANDSDATPPAEAAPAIRDPDDWKNWPVLPDAVSDTVKAIYQRGLENGNDPHAFSILGDCHSLPEVFLGLYDNDEPAVAALDEDLQETVEQFQGSFDRYSPTVVVGTTEGALLWAQWNENEEGYCEPNELPIDCELRYHKPVIAFIRIGTHWEARNEEYLRTLIEKLIDNGTVPVIVTKPDNRELDERVNHNLAKLAVEYDLPFWNFWASIQDLPNSGLSDDRDMYL